MQCNQKGFTSEFQWYSLCGAGAAQGLTTTADTAEWAATGGGGMWAEVRVGKWIKKSAIDLPEFDKKKRLSIR